MQVTYKANQKTFIGSMSHEEILEKISLMGDKEPAYITIFLGSGSNLMIAGGHSNRVVVVARDVSSNDEIINGTLVDSSLPDSNESLEFLSEFGGDPDIFRTKDSVPREFARELVNYFWRTKVFPMVLAG